MIQLVFGDSEKSILKSLLLDGPITDNLAEINDIINMIKLSASLDHGDIQCNPDDLLRRNIIVNHIHADLWDNLGINSERAKRYWDAYIADYNAFHKRIQTGEHVRIWYSDAPHSLCGFYEAVYELNNSQCSVSSIKLPDWILINGKYKQANGWGDVNIDELDKCLSLETTHSKAELLAFSDLWQTLRDQNSPLRASVNGHLISVDDSFYDSFINTQIGHETIKVSQLILNVLNSYPLCISDWLVAERIKHMIEIGILHVVKKEKRFYDSILARS